jgi:FtsH-binding integral membrane protein
MKFEKPESQNEQEYDQNESPQDNNKYNYNQNYNYNENNFQNNNLINDDMNIEMNNLQNDNQYNQYPQGIKEDVSPEDSNRLQEQERINYLIFKGFLGKVYGILSFQLLITLFFIFFFQRDSVKSFFLNNSGLTSFLNTISIVLFLGTLILLSVKEDLGKTVPNNYIALLIITLCLSFMCSTLALSYSYPIVFLSVLLTINSSIAITIYAFCTGTDWSYYRSLGSVIVSQFAGFIFMVFILDITMLEMVCCFFFTLLFGVYLVYDTQVILKKYGEVFSIDDYIFAALQIYLDIGRLFIVILSTLGKAKN